LCSVPASGILGGRCRRRTWRVRRIYDAWAAGDFGAGADTLDEHVVFAVSPDFPAFGVFHGIDGIGKYMRDFLAQWERWTVEAKRIEAVGDTVLARVVQHGKGRTSGIEGSFSHFMLFTFRGNKVVRMETVMHEHEALEAVGLSERRSRRLLSLRDTARAMSQETTDPDFELVREAWAASGTRDIRDALRFYCEDIEIMPFGATLEGRIYRGHQGVLDWWDNQILPSWAAFEVIAEDFQRVGNRLLVFGHWRASGRTSGMTLEMPATWVVEVREGKIASWQTFTDRKEAFEAVGLSEQDAHADS
jgi:ketosteroid isomerase-like protein